MLTLETFIFMMGVVKLKPSINLKPNIEDAYILGG